MSGIIYIIIMITVLYATWDGKIETTRQEQKQMGKCHECRYCYPFRKSYIGCKMPYKDIIELPNRNGTCNDFEGTDAYYKELDDEQKLKEKGYRKPDYDFM